MHSTLWRRRARQVRETSRDLSRYVASDTETRHEIVRDYVLKVARRYTGVLRAELGEFRYYVSTHDEWISKIVFRTGEFDREAMDRIMGALAIDVSDRLVLDVGANIGTTTVAFARRYGAARVLAFEPDPDNHRLLRHNLIENDADDRVRTIRAAVSNEPGTLLFGRQSHHWGGHAVVPADSSAIRGEHIEVPAVTLDALVASGDIRVNDVALLWMDIQGHEVHALAGASQLLQAGVPLVMEFDPSALRRAGRLTELSGILEPHYREIIDFGEPHAQPLREPRTLPLTDLSDLLDAYPGDRWTDIAIIA